MSKTSFGPANVKGREPQYTMNPLGGGVIEESSLAPPIQTFDADSGQLAQTLGEMELRGVPQPPPPPAFDPPLDGRPVPGPAPATPGVSQAAFAEPVVERSAPPADAGLAAQFALLQQRLEEMVDEVRAARDENDDLKFQLSVFQPLAQRQTLLGPQQAKLPPNIDPASPATMGDLENILGNVLQLLPAHAIRMSWDVTPTEEARVTELYPQIQSLGEPERTQFVITAVRRLREKSAKQPSRRAEPPAPVQPSPQRTTPPPAPPPVGRPVTTVPVVEQRATAGTAVTDPQAQSELQAAWAEYRAAETIRNSRERTQKLLAAAERIRQLTGGDPNESLRSFRQVSRLGG